MDRKKFTQTLALVEPSLANNELIPSLTHFWFTGDSVMGYNDVISISVPCETDFRGSVKGKVLYDFLSKCTGSAVEFSKINPKGLKGKNTEEDSLSDAPNLKVKCGQSSIKMRLFPEDSFLFEIPDYSDWSVVDVEPKSLTDSLNVCLESLGNHVSEPERNGITVFAKERGELHMYSTDDVTLSHAVVQNRSRSALEDRFVLSYAFCDAARKLLRWSKNGEYQMHVDADYVVMAFEGGVKLFGRLIEDVHPLDFASVFEKHLPKRDTNLLIPIPKRLGLVIERSHVAVAKSITPETVFKVVEDSKGVLLRVTASSEYGEVRDRIRLDEGEGHPEITVKVDLKRLRRCGLDVFDTIRITPVCIVLCKGKDMYHLISVLGR